MCFFIAVFLGVHSFIESRFDRSSDTHVSCEHISVYYVWYVVAWNSMSRNQQVPAKLEGSEEFILPETNTSKFAPENRWLEN